MAICSECGSELKEGAQFCNNCGSKVENNEQKIDEDITQNVQNSAYVEKYLMVYDPIFKRQRYSKAKVIGALIFALFFITGFVSLITGLMVSTSGAIVTFIISLIMGIVGYFVCSLIGNFARDI